MRDRAKMELLIISLCFILFPCSSLINGEAPTNHSETLHGIIVSVPHNSTTETIVISIEASRNHSINGTLDDHNVAVEASVKPHGPAHWGYIRLKSVLRESRDDDLLDPENWQKAFPQCNSSRLGSRQSPIRITTRNVTRDPSMAPIEPVRYSLEPRNSTWEAINNGHVVQFSGKYVTPPEIHGGGLPDDYVFLQFHFHWGGTNARGSEHTIDNRRFPLELHLVHRRSIEFDDEALSDTVGLAVLGVLFELVDDTMLQSLHTSHFEHLGTLLNALGDLDDPGEKRKLVLPGFHLEDLLPDNRTYYRYMGSLTTPPCSEAAIWNIFANPLPITAKQMLKFRQIRLRATTPKTETDDLDDFLMDNYRPLQPLAGRNVTLFVDNPVSSNVIRSLPGKDAVVNVNTTTGRNATSVGVLAQKSEVKAGGKPNSGIVSHASAAVSVFSILYLLLGP